VSRLLAYRVAVPVMLEPWTLMGSVIDGPNVFVWASRIFRVLGHPNVQDWPVLESLSHWRDNVDNIRMRNPGHTGNR
jgi:hypothetical protein